VPLPRRPQKVLLPSGRTVWVKPPPRGKKRPPTQPLMGDEAAHRFLAELAVGRWQEFHDFLDGTRDWDDRHFYLTRLAAVDGRPDWIAEWRAARPDSALPLLFGAAHAIHRAQADQDASFQARLAEADRDLAAAAAMDEADPTAHACGVTAAMGLRLGQPEVRRRIVEMARRHRWHQAGNAAAVQALAARWGGSDKDMFEFARWVAGTAPEGNGVHKVIALTHLERWLSLPEEPGNGAERQRGYFLQEAVRKEVRRAADRSIRSARYQPHRLTPGDRNVFAMCFWLMRDHEAQLEQMRLIGPLIQAHPWHYLGDPGCAYEQAHTWASEITRKIAAGPGRN
jgi:hypothetical protein